MIADGQTRHSRLSCGLHEAVTSGQVAAQIDRRHPGIWDALQRSGLIKRDLINPKVANT
jgi:hypothetical protein